MYFDNQYFSRFPASPDYSKHEAQASHLLIVLPCAKNGNTDALFTSYWQANISVASIYLSPADVGMISLHCWDAT